MSSTQNRTLQPVSAARPRFRGEPALKHQRGMGMLTILVIMAISIFLGLFAFKVGPNYMESWTVSKIADDVAANPELMKQPRSKVYQYIHQAYRTNNLWDLKPEDTIKLKKDGKRGYIVSVEYEKRENLFSNIDVVTSFNKEATSVP